MPHVMDDRFATWSSVGNDKNSNQEDINIFVHALFLFIETLNFLDYLLPPHWSSRLVNTVVIVKTQHKAK